MGRTRYVRYSLALKLKVIKFAKSNSKNKASKNFRVNHKQIRKWIENKQKIIDSPSRVTKARIQRDGTTLYSDLENELKAWILEQRLLGYIVDGNSIKNSGGATLWRTVAFATLIFNLLWQLEKYRDCSGIDSQASDDDNNNECDSEDELCTTVDPCSDDYDDDYDILETNDEVYRHISESIEAVISDTNDPNFDITSKNKISCRKLQNGEETSLRKKIRFDEKPGPSHYAATRIDHTMLSAFMVIFDSSMIDMVLKFTNQFALDENSGLWTNQEKYCTNRGNRILEIDKIISEMAEIKSFKQFFTKENLLNIYQVLEQNNMSIHNLTMETKEKVQYMEMFYRVNKMQNFVYQNSQDDIPSNQLARY
ncbi:unnamed protein product [Brachionus calyciflorus]|uniref:HTH CENPB-type domain-containing protein n=1 Tax=Brachionus calyciflorus TaxID=104777 RepID=A0A814M9N9_9BILA|nr:unnamed protein product [Brachionus calyciflorus]